MSLLVVGLSHRSAPVSVLERAALAPAQRGPLLQDVLSAEPATEAAVLSTCNRIELYADVDKFHAGVAELSTLLAEHSAVGIEELTPYLYVHYEDRAVHHLFTVACGLDSMVVGEGQILGQIKDALAVAQDQHSAGRLVNDLFQQALRVGKRAHSETGIDKAGQSLVTFGLAQLANGAHVADSAHVANGAHVADSANSAGSADFADIDSIAEWAAGKRALIIGAGSMSSLAAATLVRAGVTELVIANRTLERARRLSSSLSAYVPSGPTLPAQAVGTESDEVTDGDPAARRNASAARRLVARAIPMAEVISELPAVDVVVSCTGATGLVLTGAAVEAVVAERVAASTGTPSSAVRAERLAILDLAMPRDIDAAVHRVDGVRLVDIESLAEAAADAPMSADVDAVRGIVSEEVAAFGAAQRAATITPTVIALRSMASDVVTAEMARLDGRLPQLGEKERAEISQTVRRVVDKLLHAPTVRVKQLAGEPGGAGYADALRELFDLDPETVAAVSKPNRSGRE